jgi:hypothetical protein
MMGTLRHAKKNAYMKLLENMMASNRSMAMLKNRVKVEVST